MRARRKRNIVIGALCGVLLLMSVGYAAFNSTLNIKGTSSISSNWDISITNVVSKNIVGEASNAKDPEWDNLTASVEANLTNPGDSIEYDVTIENRGTINAKLEKVTLSDTKNSAIKFTSSGIKEGEVLNAGSSAVLTIKIEYDKNVTGQPGETTSELKVTLDYVQANVGEGGIAIPSGSDTLIENVVTEGDGLYEDPVEAGRYVYRGSNPDNYITFNGEEAGWRIISVESDGTIKIMTRENSEYRQFEAKNTRTAEYCNYSNYGCNVWGSASTMLDTSGNNVDKMRRAFNETNTYALPTEESQTAQYLNVEYYNTLTEEAKSQIDNHLWNVGPVPMSILLEDEVEQERSYKWRGKIGLINPSDYVKASTDNSCQSEYISNTQSGYVCKNNNYLVNKARYWTMTPQADVNSHRAWTVTPTGSLNISVLTDISALYPVVFLKSDINLSGTGTQEDPFTIK